MESDQDSIKLLTRLMLYKEQDLNQQLKMKYGVESKLFISRSKIVFNKILTNSHISFFYKIVEYLQIQNLRYLLLWKISSQIGNYINNISETL